MQYVLQESEIENHWVCTDTENLIVCVFENHKFNDTQKFTMLENFDPQNYMKLANICRLIGDYLKENHYEKIF